MDFFEDIIPILIFILIPVIRGINSSKKQKKEYQKKLGSRPQGQGGSPHRSSSSQTRRLQPWRELIDEIGREFKKAIEEETNKKAYQTRSESYSENPRVNPDTDRKQNRRRIRTIQLFLRKNLYLRTGYIP